MLAQKAGHEIAGAKVFLLVGKLGDQLAEETDDGLMVVKQVFDLL